MAYDFYPGENSRLTAAFDATHPNDYSEKVHFGSEYSWQEKLFLRAGYTSNSEEQGLSAGCGANLNTDCQLRRDRSAAIYRLSSSTAA